jgi:uncharacterized membrane protein
LAASDDGSIIGGARVNAIGLDAVVWTVGSGARVLPHMFPPETYSATVIAMSPDGSVVAGQEWERSNQFTNQHGFIWTAEGGIRELPVPPGSPALSMIPEAISADGRTVVGFVIDSPNEVQACVWTAAFGTRYIPFAAGNVASGSDNVSGDGWSVALDMSTATGPQSAYLWDPVHGPRDLKQLLLSLGANGASGFRLGNGYLSTDGRTVVGTAVYPTTPPITAVYIATVPGFCYPNCDGSTGSPALNINDFICFQTKLAAGEPFANCDGSSRSPALNINDFICFQTKFAAGCR